MTERGKYEAVGLLDEVNRQNAAATLGRHRDTCDACQHRTAWLRCRVGDVLRDYVDGAPPWSNHHQMLDSIRDVLDAPEVPSWDRILTIRELAERDFVEPAR